jgi:hypothetical protein
MLIVEGCDNAGKTTLVSRLSGELKLITVCNRRRPASLDASWNYLIRVMPLASHHPTVFDRFQPISEPIYGPICRNTHLFKLEDKLAQLKFIRRSGVEPMIIYCRPSLDRILNFGEREQMAGVIENAPAIVERYDGVMEWLEKELQFRVVQYDYEHDSYDALKESARQHLEAMYK